MTAEPGQSPLVAGGPTPDEIAAVLAALAQCGPGPAASGYERWRRTRLAVRTHTGHDEAARPRR